MVTELLPWIEAGGGRGEAAHGAAWSLPDLPRVRSRGAAGRDRASAAAPMFEACV